MTVGDQLGFLSHIAVTQSMKSIEKHALLMFMTTFARKAILVDPMDMASSSPATVVKAAVLDTKSTRSAF